MSSHLFYSLVKVIGRYHLMTDKIYNIDETGITVKPWGLSKILTLNGRREVGIPKPL
jgi:hypothetical protein